MTSGAGVSLTYDEANRVAWASPTSGGTEYYGYAPDNKRIYRRTAAGTEELTWYGAKGEKLAVFQIGGNSLFLTSRYVWFAGKLILDGNGVFQDRLGTNRANGARYLPFGEELTTTAGDHVKFGTYTRDSFTGLDYADQRYYASGLGRFNTPDPYMAAAHGANNPSDPGTWNRYAYVGGNPASKKDPKGLWACEDCGEDGSIACQIGYHWDEFSGFCEPDNPGGPPPDPPTGSAKCGDDQASQWVLNNYQSVLDEANKLGKVGGLSGYDLADMLFAWSVSEIGYGTAQTYITNGTYFNERPGGWIGEITCGKGTDPGWACFGFRSMGDAIDAALNTKHTSSPWPKDATALSVMQSQTNGSVTSIMQAVGRYWDPGNASYGATVADDVAFAGSGNGVRSRRECWGWGK